MPNEPNKFLEAMLEGAEAAVDSLSDNELVKNIPIVGTAIKLVSGTLDLRDRIFVSKIDRFIQSVDSVSKEDRMEFREEIIGNREKMSSVGETALLVIDKLSDLKKAEILGFYFACFLSGEIDEYQFRRISAAIEVAFIDDIENFFDSGLKELQSQRHFMGALMSSGMTIISAGKTIDEVGELYYEASSMGREMIDLWNDYKPI